MQAGTEVGQADAFGLPEGVAGGAHRVVALAGERVVGQGVPASERDAGRGQGAHVRLALALVGVEHPGVLRAGRHQVQLEREVGRVAHPRAHALPEERRHPVGGVAREQDAPVAPAPRDQGAERVGRDPLDVGVGRGEVALHPPPHLRVGDLAPHVGVVEHEAEPLAPGTGGEDRGGPVRIADLQGRGQAQLGGGTAEHEVAPQPRFGEAEVVLVDAERRAHEAVAAVAAHDVARPHRAALGRDEPDLVLGAVEAGHRRAEPDLDRGQRPAPRVQRPLQDGLVEHEQVGPSAVADEPALQAEQDLPGGVAPLVGLLHVQGGQELLGQAEPGEQPEDLAVEAGRTGQAVERGMAFQHDHRATRLPQQRRQCQTHRPRAHHRHVHDVVGHRPAVLTCGRCAGQGMSTSLPGACPASPTSCAFAASSSGKVVATTTRSAPDPACSTS